MATGASTADLAVVLVDARKGLLTQTRRHTFIASLLGIRHIIVAINKIDLVNYDRSIFEKIDEDFRAMSADMGFASITSIPLSARFGDNVTAPSPSMDWYNGPTLLGHLETVEFEDERLDSPFRFPVQYVSRPDLNFRGFAGTLAAGSVKPGDPVVVAKSGKPSTVKRIVTMDGDLDKAVEGQAVTLVLEDEIEVSRGNMLVAPEARPEVADQFAANIVWFSEDAMLPGRQFILRTETDRTTVSVNDLRHRIDVNSFAHEAAKSLELNEVGYCHLSAQSPIAFDPYSDNRATGAFILIDRLTNATVGAGMIV
ncbi:UNVERIFIED_CONTAM: hypothetical protein GTU68_060706, partial [Idotea baltica]|nr:hypothetical protein [Idotea baltica]